MALLVSGGAAPVGSNWRHMAVSVSVASEVFCNFRLTVVKNSLLGGAGVTVDSDLLQPPIPNNKREKNQIKKWLLIENDFFIKKIF